MQFSLLTLTSESTHWIVVIRNINFGWSIRLKYFVKTQNIKNKYKYVLLTYYKWDLITVINEKDVGIMALPSVPILSQFFG